MVTSGRNAILCEFKNQSKSWYFACYYMELKATELLNLSGHSFSGWILVIFQLWLRLVTGDNSFSLVLGLC